MINISSLIITIAAFLLSISFHECSHALAAYALGDDTAKKAGRLTMNPLSHIDPLGLLMIILIRIGWAKPVPFDARNFSHPRLYSILVGLAGPASNFILALVCLYTVKFFPWSLLSNSVTVFLLEFLRALLGINVMLGIFNLIPLPPLDGSHIIEVFVPERFKNMYYRFQSFSIIILVVLLNIPAFQRAFFAAISFTTHLLTQLVF